MKIGLYKPFKKVYFNKNDDDHAGWSIEVVNVAKILARHGVDVYILTNTDYNESTQIPHIFTLKEGQGCPQLDKVIVFNGVFGADEDLVLKDIKEFYKCPIELIVTDLALRPKDMSVFNKVYYESKNEGTYLPIGRNYLFDFERDELNKVTKDIKYYFGGTEKKRLKDFLEYVWRPDCLWHGKSAFLNVADYVPFNEHLALMKRTKYSIMINDTTYNEIGMVTPRYWECIMLGILAFVDMKYDKDELYIRLDDFRRVSSYLELVEKIKLLEEHPDYYMALIDKQYDEITDDDKNGTRIFNILTQ